MTDTYLQRLKEEYEELENDPLTDIGCNVCLREEDDYLHWEGMMQGPDDSPYAGAFLYFTLDFTKEFPIKAPEFKFINKNMYHLNVRSDGHVCIEILNHWVSETKIREVILGVFAILYEQNPDSSYYPDKVELYKKDILTFNKNISDWVRQYALVIK